MQDLWYSSVSLQCYMLQWLQMVCGNLNELGSVYTLVDFCEKKRHAFVHVFSLAAGCVESVSKPLLPCTLFTLFVCVCTPVFNHRVKKLYCTLFFQSIALNLLKMADCIRDLCWTETGWGGSCFERTAVPWPCVYSAKFTSLSFLACCEAIAWGHG